MRRNLLLSVLGVFFSQYIFSQTVTRGPYLQSLTSASIKIKWRTSSATDSRVYYSTDSANLNLYSDAAASVTNHTVQLTNLQPYTTYYYSVGSTIQVQSGPSNLHRFKTAPTTGTVQPYRFWAIGDFGKNNQGQRDVLNSYVTHSGSDHIDMWLWLGDCAYDNGTDAEYQTKVFDVYADIMKYLPFYSSPGNHDYGSICPIPCFSNPTGHSGPYFDIIDVPVNGEAGGVASGYELYYSFDYGNVHFISLNSELGSLIGSYDWNGVYGAGNFSNSPARQWLINDLTTNTLPWVIVYFHQPPYTDGSHHSDDLWELYMAAMRNNYTPVFEQYGVDIVLCGHSHVFERSYLLKGFHGLLYPTSSSFDMNTHVVNNKSGKFSLGEAYVKYTDGPNVNEGTVYVVTGNSGSSEPGASLNHPAFYYDTDGYGSFMIEVNDMRLDGKYLSSSGAVLDEFTILKTSTLPGFVEGHVKGETGQMIPSVTLDLAGPGTQSATTAADGSYRFNVSQAGTYTITPSKDNDVNKSNGVSTSDILMIRRHILAIGPLQSPYKIIAADVNGSGTVSTTDILLIQSLILGNTTTFPNGKIWAFVPQSHIFSDTVNPFPYPASSSYTALSQVSGQDFTGMKLGDVNNSWNPNIPKTAAAGIVGFMMDEYNVSEGDEIIVPVRVKDFNKISGYQFTLSWNSDVLSLLEVKNKALSGNYGVNRAGEGYLTVLWSDEEANEVTLDDDEVVFEIKFRSTGEDGTSSQINIGSEITLSEAYNGNLDLLSVASVNGKVAIGQDSCRNESNICSLSVQPNPFTQSTHVIFEISRDERVTIAVMDIFGKEVSRIAGNYAAGKHKAEWNASGLARGLYHVRMIAGSTERSIKALLLE